MKSFNHDSIQTSNIQLVVFDGICNLCNWWVMFLLKRDSKKQFHFTPIQSKLAEDIKLKYNINEKNCDSILYLKGEQLLVKSSAALNILKDLGGIWKLFYLFIIVPASIRDYIYGFIAENRYKWFGKKNQCMIPKQEVRNQFLDF